MLRIERSETSDEIFNQFQTTAETPEAEPYEKAATQEGHRYTRNPDN